MTARRIGGSLAWIVAVFALLFVVAVLFGPRIVVGLGVVIVLVQLFRRRG